MYRLESAAMTKSQEAAVDRRKKTRKTKGDASG